jgi:hypothetical protein
VGSHSSIKCWDAHSFGAKAVRCGRKPGGGLLRTPNVGYRIGQFRESA